MDGLEPTRKCFRLVGGVLVERTVAEVPLTPLRSVWLCNNFLGTPRRHLKQGEDQVRH